MRTSANRWLGIGLIAPAGGIAFNDDPNASVTALVAFTVYALLFASFAAFVYRPLFRASGKAERPARAIVDVP
jgi:hypothetical protein